VAARIARGRDMSASDYVELARVRARLVQAFDARLADLDALVMPTTPIVAPTNERGRHARDLQAEKFPAPAQYGNGQFSSIFAPYRCRCRAPAVCLPA